MNNILQRHWLTTVRRVVPGNFLEARTVYCGTDCEVGALLKVDAVSFTVVEAIWENYSPPVANMDIPSLRGIKAYFDCGPALKEALAGLGAFPRAIFADTVRGVIQAETFLYNERGFASAEEYSNYWEKFYAGSCRYYSNLHRISRKWYEYVSHMRISNLFNRFKAQAIYRETNGNYRVCSQLSDSFHELNVEIILNEDLVTTECRGTLLRVPDPVCREAAVFLGQMVGQQAGVQSKKQIAGLLGQGDGCVHLIDMISEAFESIAIATKGVGII